MGRELAGFRRQPDPAHDPLVLGLQLDERLARLHRNIERMRLVAAERAEPGQRHFERALAHRIEHVGNVVGGSFADIADEAQGDVEVFRLDPAGGAEPALQAGEVVCHAFRDFEAGEEAGHGQPPCYQDPESLQDRSRMTLTGPDVTFVTCDRHPRHGPSSMARVSER